MVIVSNSFCFVNRKKEKSEYIFSIGTLIFAMESFCFLFAKKYRF